MTEISTPSPASPSGDQSPLLVRIAESISRKRVKGEGGSLSLERALWAMVLVQVAQMDTNNLAWFLSLLL